MASSKAVFGHYNFVFIEGKIEVVVYLGALRFDNICNDVNFIALNQKVRSIFTVKYEPEHQGQKQVGNRAEEVKNRTHYIYSKVGVEYIEYKVQF